MIPYLGRMQARTHWIAGWTLTLLAVIGVGVGTLLPPGTMPDEAPGSDKLHHFLGFFAVVLPVVAVRPRYALWLVPAAIGYGAVIEVIQPHFGRQFSYGDMAANAAGAAVGAACGVLLHRFWQRRQRRGTACTKSG